MIVPPTRPYVDEVGAPPGRAVSRASFSMPCCDPIDPDCETAVRRTAALFGGAWSSGDGAEPPYPDGSLASAMRVFMSVPLAVDIDARLCHPAPRAGR